MFSDDLATRIGAAGRIATAALFLAGPAAAQSSFGDGSFGGSFDTEPGQGAAGTQPAPPGSQVPGGSFGGSFDTAPGPGTAEAPPPDAPGEGFGGSFGAGGSSVPDAPTGGGVAPPPGGDGDFGGGSFRPGGSPPDQATPVSPEMPAPQPEPPTPQIHPQIAAFETQDFGVPPSSTLRAGQFHAPTPTVLPGGSLITTEALAAALNSGQQIVVIDVLGADYAIPTSFQAPALSSPGSFDDRTQQQAAQWLSQITNGNRQVPIVIYCSDPQCWLSYNGALRTIAAGYSNVLWYRGGLQAWEMAGLQLQPAGF